MPAALTDIGCEREINEDRYAVIESSIGKAWVVCDGMGGAVGGELAAQLAIDTIRRTLETRDYSSPEEAITDAVEEANRIIMLRRQNPAFSSMGTTIVAGIVNDDKVVFVSAGDSRVYRISDGDFTQLTVDHTYVQELVDRGAVTPEEALNHPHSHVLTRCLGAEPRLRLDRHEYWVWEAAPEDPRELLLFCSDGLYSLVSDLEIANSVSTKSPQEACVHLVELAKSRGGYDNITVIILPVKGKLRTEEKPASISPKRALAIRKPTAPRPQMMPQQPSMSSTKKIVGALLLFMMGTVLAALITVIALSFG